MRPNALKAAALGLCFPTLFMLWMAIVSPHKTTMDVLLAIWPLIGLPSLLAGVYLFWIDGVSQRK